MPVGEAESLPVFAGETPWGLLPAAVMILDQRGSVVFTDAVGFGRQFAGVAGRIHSLEVGVVGHASVTNI
jgi:hypothetical protein